MLGFGLSVPFASVHAGGFSPLALFAANEPGAWYDPSDLTTLYQDSAGTTPVTAVEQPVGLMLDRSRGLVLGSELVTNGDFSSGTGWTLGAGWTISGGSLNGATGAFSEAWTGFTTTAGRMYRVQLTLATSAGSVLVYISNGANVSLNSTGTITVYLIAGSSGNRLSIGGVNFTGTIDNISVRELPGNHAIQPTASSRPVLSARVNLLTATDTLGTSNWTGVGVSATQGQAAPNGSSTAVLLTEGANTNQHYWYQTLVNSTSGLVTRHKVWAKSNGRNLRVSTVTGGSASGAFAEIDLTNGSVFSSGVQAGGGAVVSATCVPAGSGWFEITLDSSLSTTGANWFYVLQLRDGLSASPGEPTYAGNGTSGVYIWQPDLRVANDGVGIPAYQRVTTATDYDTAGFPLYLRFDGVDDSLYTSSIDFSGTDKMTVVAGYALGAADLYANIVNLGNGLQGGVPGGFWLHNTQLNELVMTVQGTGVASNYAGYSSNGFAVPASRVQVFSANLSSVGASYPNIVAGFKNSPSTLTLNPTGAGIPGAGTFGNLPLFLGRVWSRTLRGRLYPVIVRGAATNASDLAQAESWMNGKTRAY